MGHDVCEDPGGTAEYGIREGPVDDLRDMRRSLHRELLVVANPASMYEWREFLYQLQSVDLRRDILLLASGMFQWGIEYVYGLNTKVQWILSSFVSYCSENFS
ncbi:hypothetical protein JTB14_001005 [Gonioctena quinquepunctata]|nr:hypothetical protein JTB14_001005 [Gonioctena quinquepunctata]